MNLEPAFRVSYLRIRFSLICVGIGLFVFVIGAKPNWFGWSTIPEVGFFQIALFLIGLALICVGGFIGISALWGKEQRSILDMEHGAIVDCEPPPREGPVVTSRYNSSA